MTSSEVAFREGRGDQSISNITLGHLLDHNIIIENCSLKSECKIAYLVSGNRVDHKKIHPGLKYGQRMVLAHDTNTDHFDGKVTRPVGSIRVRVFVFVPQKSGSLLRQHWPPYADLPNILKLTKPIFFLALSWVTKKLRFQIHLIQPDKTYGSIQIPNSWPKFFKIGYVIRFSGNAECGQWTRFLSSFSP